MQGNVNLFPYKSLVLFTLKTSLGVLRPWWVGPGWIPGAPKAALPLPFPAGQGRGNEMKGSGQGEGQGEITQQSLPWANQTQLGELSLIYCQ